jgi:DNA-binding response OmpR family regulator
MTSKIESILCIDKDKHTCLILTYLFSSESFEIITCDNFEEALLKTSRKEFSAIIMDNGFGDQSSYEVCRQLRLSNPQIPIIFYSSDGRKTEIEKAFAAGADEYLLKPLGLEKIVPLVRRLIDRAGRKLHLLIMAFWLFNLQINDWQEMINNWLSV